MTNDIKKIINLLPYVGLVAVIVLPWFLGSGYLFFTDMSWGPNIVLPHWTSGWFYLSLLIKGLGFFISVDLLQKLFISAVLGAVLFGGYRIARSLTQDKMIWFLASAFALFNPFVYDRLMYGQIGVILAYGFFLACFGCLLSFYFNLQRERSILMLRF